MVVPRGFVSLLLKLHQECGEAFVRGHFQVDQVVLGFGDGVVYAELLRELLYKGLPIGEKGVTGIVAEECGVVVESDALE
ncbi:hypothetical protein C0992_002218, partial [Termitomyces sp. T32_za158]